MVSMFVYFSMRANADSNQLIPFYLVYHFLGKNVIESGAVNMCANPVNICAEERVK